MNRCTYFLCLVLFASGCGPGTNGIGSNNVLFQQIEGAVADIEMNVAGPHFSGDLGDDRLGMSVAAFQKSVAGTKLEEVTNKLAAKVTEVSTMASKRPKIDKLRAAVKELVKAVEDVKAQL